MLEISTLGGLVIQRDGKPVTGLVTRKVEALLVYLACTVRPHPRDVLAELLWEERTQTQALSNLRVALSNLRKCLDTYVEITRDSASINPDAEIWLDVAELEKEPSLPDSLDDHGSSLSPAAIRQLERQVSLYKGDFLAGFPIRSCPGFENWMTFQQERVRLVFERKITDLINGLLATERWLDVIKWGEYWIAYGYHPELAYRGLMTAYAGLGDLASMSTIYQRCVAAFRDELGIDPSKQTRRLYESLLQGEKPPGLGLVTARESQVSSPGRSARLILDQFQPGDGKVLDVASLAVIYTSRNDLDFEPKDLTLLLRSALHHGTEIQPWINRFDSPQSAVETLAVNYKEYPKPKSRLKIIDALKKINLPASTELLVQIGTSDDAPEVRAEAAVAAARRKRNREILVNLLPQLRSPNHTAALAAFVAVVDEVGLPREIQSYPKLPVVVALARKRWQASKDLVTRQIVRGTIGGALSVGFFGSLLPVFVFWANPVAFNENLMFISVVAWVLSGVFTGFIVGGLQGAALSFAVGLADVLYGGSYKKRPRILFSGIAGLVYSLYLITFSLTGLLVPEVEPWLYIIVYIVYGILWGMALSFVVPPIGTRKSAHQQLAHVCLTLGLIAATALLAITLVYPETKFFRFVQEVCFIIFFTSGMAIATNRSQIETDQGGSD